VTRTFWTHAEIVHAAAAIGAALRRLLRHTPGGCPGSGTPTFSELVGAAARVPSTGVAFADAGYPLFDPAAVECLRTLVFRWGGWDEDALLGMRMVTPRPEVVAAFLRLWAFPVGGAAQPWVPSLDLPTATQWACSSLDPHVLAELPAVRGEHKAAAMAGRYVHSRATKAKQRAARLAALPPKVPKKRGCPRKADGPRAGL